MHCPTMEEKAWDTTLFLSAIVHNMQVIHDDFLVFSAIFAGPRFVEIQKFCYHGNVTKRDLVLSHFVITLVALCNNRPSHFVIKKAVALCTNTCRTL